MPQQTRVSRLATHHFTASACTSDDVSSSCFSTTCEGQKGQPRYLSPSPVVVWWVWVLSGPRGKTRATRLADTLLAVHVQLETLLAQLSQQVVGGHVAEVWQRRREERAASQRSLCVPWSVWQRTVDNAPLSWLVIFSIMPLRAVVDAIGKARSAKVLSGAVLCRPFSRHR